MHVISVGFRAAVAFARLWVRARAALEQTAAPEEPSAEELRVRHEIVGDPDAQARLAIIDDETVGLYLLTVARENRGAGEPIPATAHLRRVAVEPSRWGRGIGTSLLEDARSLADRAGFDSLELVVRADNQRARRLYERHGWRQAGDCYVHERTGCLMIRYHREAAQP